MMVNLLTRAMTTRCEQKPSLAVLADKINKKTWFLKM